MSSDANLSCLLKAMIIIAWNGSGQLGSIFVGDVFKRVMSIFITAAILKLAQGEDLFFEKDWLDYNSISFLL